MHRLVIRWRASAIDASENPDQAGRRLVFGHAGWKSARPSRPGDRVGLRAGASRALARNLKHGRPRVKHWKQIITPMPIRDAEHVWLLAYVDPSRRIEGVCIWSGNIAKGSIRIGSH